MRLLKIEINDMYKCASWVSSGWVVFKKPLGKTMPQRNSSLLLLLSPLFLSSAAQFFSKKKGLMVITAFAAAAAGPPHRARAHRRSPSPRYSVRRLHSLFTRTPHTQILCEYSKEKTSRVVCVRRVLTT